jgi:hypothetical protein
VRLILILKYLLIKKYLCAQKLQKKTNSGSSGFNYGVKFFNSAPIFKENLSEFIAQNNPNFNDTSLLENTNSLHQSKLLIFSNNFDNLPLLKTEFKKFQLRKYYIVNSLESLKLSTIEEIPKLVIIDGLSLNSNQIFNAVNELINFPSTDVLIIEPFDSPRNLNIPNVNVLYYPFVQGEFENFILKFI